MTQIREPTETEPFLADDTLKLKGRELKTSGFGCWQEDGQEQTDNLATKKLQLELTPVRCITFNDSDNNLVNLRSAPADLRVKVRETCFPYPVKQSVEAEDNTAGNMDMEEEQKSKNEICIDMVDHSHSNGHIPGDEEKSIPPPNNNDNDQHDPSRRNNSKTKLCNFLNKERLQVMVVILLVCLSVSVTVHITEIVKSCRHSPMKTVTKFCYPSRTKGSTYVCTTDQSQAEQMTQQYIHEEAQKVLQEPFKMFPNGTSDPSHGVHRGATAVQLKYNYRQRSTPGQPVKGKYTVQAWEKDVLLNAKYAEGKITIKTTGRYFVFSQVHFLVRPSQQVSPNIKLGHYLWVYRSAEMREKEERMYSSEHPREENSALERTSYLWNVMKLKEGDQIFVRVNNLRFIHNSDKSTYFGVYLIK